MATQFKTILYGGPKGIAVDKADVAAIGQEAGKYLKARGMQAQGIKLPGLSKAQAMVAKCLKVQQAARASSQVKDLGFTPELVVLGGLDTKGDLSVSVTGVLPPAKPGGAPMAFEKSEVIRKDWAKLEKELGDEKNVVVNLTRQNMSIVEEALDKLVAKHGGDEKKVKADPVFKALLDKFQGGDRIINGAAEKQARLYRTEAVDTSDADFGEITTGTVALCAHGSREKVNGVWLGTKLGKKTPDELVTLLTGNKDRKKNLSKDFRGTVLLSGCFTAAGGIAPPGKDYDYDTYAGKVWTLLKAKGIKCKVVGQPGTASTNDDGSKNSVMPTRQDDKDAFKAEITQLEKDLKALDRKLKSGDAKTRKDATKKAQALYGKIKVARDKSALTWMKDLQVSYGLDPLR